MTLDKLGNLALDLDIFPVGAIIVIGGVNFDFLFLFILVMIPFVLHLQLCKSFIIISKLKNKSIEISL